MSHLEKKKKVFVEPIVLIRSKRLLQGPLNTNSRLCIKRLVVFVIIDHPFLLAYVIGLVGYSKSNTFL